MRIVITFTTPEDCEWAQRMAKRMGFDYNNKALYPLSEFADNPSIVLYTRGDQDHHAMWMYKRADMGRQRAYLFSLPDNRLQWLMWAASEGYLKSTDEIAETTITTPATQP